MFARASVSHSVWVNCSKSLVAQPMARWCVISFVRNLKILYILMIYIFTTWISRCVWLPGTLRCLNLHKLSYKSAINDSRGKLITAQLRPRPLLERRSSGSIAGICCGITWWVDFWVWEDVCFALDLPLTQDAKTGSVGKNGRILLVVTIACWVGTVDPM